MNESANRSLNNSLSDSREVQPSLANTASSNNGFNLAFAPGHFLKKFKNDSSTIEITLTPMSDMEIVQIVKVKEKKKKNNKKNKLNKISFLAGLQLECLDQFLLPISSDRFQ